MENKLKMIGNCNHIHRRQYFPDTDSNYLFKAEQPEYVKPLNHVKANFVKMDFTENPNREISIKAQVNESEMRKAEKIKQERANDFMKLTRERAQKIKRKMKKEEELIRKEVIKTPRIF